MTLFNSMTKEQAECLYRLCEKEDPATVVKLIKDDIKAFTNNFSKNYATPASDDFLTDLIIEQNEQK